MSGRSALHREKHDAGIEGHEAPVMLERQRRRIKTAAIGPAREKKQD